MTEIISPPFCPVVLYFRNFEMLDPYEIKSNNKKVKHNLSFPAFACVELLLQISLQSAVGVCYVIIIAEENVTNIAAKVDLTFMFLHLYPSCSVWEPGNDSVVLQLYDSKYSVFSV